MSPTFGLGATSAITSRAAPQGFLPAAAGILDGNPGEALPPSRAAGAGSLVLDEQRQAPARKDRPALPPARSQPAWQMGASGIAYSGHRPRWRSNLGSGGNTFRHQRTPTPPQTRHRRRRAQTISPSRPTPSGHRHLNTAGGQRHDRRPNPPAARTSVNNRNRNRRGPRRQHRTDSGRHPSTNIHSGP